MPPGMGIQLILYIAPGMGIQLIYCIAPGMGIQLIYGTRYRNPADIYHQVGEFS